MLMLAEKLGQVLFIYYLIMPVWSLLHKRRIIKIIEFMFSIILVTIGLIVCRIGTFIQILLSIIIGLIFLVVTIIMTTSSSEMLERLIRDINRIPEVIVNTPSKSLRVLLSNIKEELIWRTAFVHLLALTVSDKHFIIAIGTLLFYLVHIPGMRPVVLWAHLEFILFSLFLYTVYLWTGSILAVILIHFIRNIYIMLVTERIICGES